MHVDQIRVVLICIFTLRRICQSLFCFAVACMVASFSNSVLMEGQRGTREGEGRDGSAKTHHDLPRYVDHFDTTGIRFVT